MRILAALAAASLLLATAARAHDAATPARDPCQSVPYVQLEHPEWSKNATIYELNTRQFTPEGIFRAAEKHLPRLKKQPVAEAADDRLRAGAVPRPLYPLLQRGAQRSMRQHGSR